MVGEEKKGGGLGEREGDGDCEWCSFNPIYNFDEIELHWRFEVI